MDLKVVIKLIAEKENISYEEAEKVFDDIWFNTADSYGQYCYECGIKDGELMGYQKPVEGYTTFEGYLEGER